MEKIVEFKKIDFGYRDIKNIDDVSFDIYKNEYICIIGHNGSGKSTISKLLAGILQQWSGTIKVLGTKVDKESDNLLKKNIGIIFQNPDNQFIGLSAVDDIAFGLENRKFLPEEMQKTINRVSKMLSIENLLDKEPASLSAGQKQKVAIASILAIDPEIFIFDESTSMLDPKSKIEIRDLMLKLKNDFGKTVISITHNMDEVVAADRVFVMEAGKLVKVGTPQEIFSNHEELVKLKLDLPFVTQIAMYLKENKKNVNLTFDSKVLIKEIIDNYGSKK